MFWRIWSAAIFMHTEMTGESFHWLQQAKALCQHRGSFSPNSLKNKSNAEHKMEEVKKCRTLVSHLACSKNKRRQQQKKHPCIKFKNRIKTTVHILTLNFTTSQVFQFKTDNIQMLTFSSRLYRTKLICTDET